MSGLFLRRQRLIVIAILALGCLLLYRVSANKTSSPPVSTLAAPTPGAALVGGVEGGDREAGRSIYLSKCASCHGTSGKGDGWRAWLFRLTMRDLTESAYMQTVPDEYLFQIIKQGGANLGKPGMPSWGQELNDREINSLVMYIRGLALPLQQPQPPGTTR